MDSAASLLVFASPSFDRLLSEAFLADGTLNILIVLSFYSEAWNSRPPCPKLAKVSGPSAFGSHLRSFRMLARQYFCSKKPSLS